MPASRGNCIFASSTTLSMGLAPRGLSQFAEALNPLQLQAFTAIIYSHLRSVKAL